MASTSHRGDTHRISLSNLICDTFDIFHTDTDIDRDVEFRMDSLILFNPILWSFIHKTFNLIACYTKELAFCFVLVKLFCISVVDGL